MTKALMAIKPEYEAKILSGEKCFEYRKTKCKEPISHIIIYETRPIQKIVAEVEVLRVLEDTPERIWRNTSMKSGIDQSFFDQYFLNKHLAVAYQLGKITVFNPPRTLMEFGVSRPPQSYTYIEEEMGNRFATY